MVGCALLGLALALAALLPAWYVQTYGSDHAARLTRTGAAAAPSLLPLTLVAAAGLAAAYAARGWAGRLIGAVLAAAGAGIAVAAVSTWRGPPGNLGGPAGPPAPPELMDPVRTHPVGPALALLGGLLIGFAGVAVMTGRAGRRLGRRFDAPASTAAAHSRVPGQVTDTDAADGWWKALDAGVDPTSAGPGVVGPPPGRRLP